VTTTRIIVVGPDADKLALAIENEVQVCTVTREGHSLMVTGSLDDLVTTKFAALVEAFPDHRIMVSIWENENYVAAKEWNSKKART
jgi:hypothetical protein